MKSSMSILRALNKKYQDQYHDAKIIKLIMTQPLIDQMDS